MKTRPKLGSRRERKRLSLAMSVNREIIGGLVCCCLLLGCAARYARNDLVAAADTGRSPLVLDVRSQGEYRQGHVPGAINMNVMMLPFRMDEIGAAKDGPVVVYCAHGPRAGLAGFFLRLGGFNQVYHLDGDMNGWRKAGLPLATSEIAKEKATAGEEPPLSRPDNNE